MAKLTQKSRIFNHLQYHFGTKPFRYTDIVIAALMVREIIPNPSWYDHTDHRGFYAGSIVDTEGYMYKPSKNDQRRLIKTEFGYQVVE
jgi:hypothetical protein